MKKSVKRFLSTTLAFTMLFSCMAVTNAMAASIKSGSHDFDESYNLGIASITETDTTETEGGEEVQYGSVSYVEENTETEPASFKLTNTGTATYAYLPILNASGTATTFTSGTVTVSGYFENSGNGSWDFLYLMDEDNSSVVNIRNDSTYFSLKRNSSNISQTTITRDSSRHSYTLTVDLSNSKAYLSIDGSSNSDEVTITNTKIAKIALYANSSGRYVTIDSTSITDGNGNTYNISYTNYSVSSTEGYTVATTDEKTVTTPAHIEFTGDTSQTSTLTMPIKDSDGNSVIASSGKLTIKGSFSTGSASNSWQILALRSSTNSNVTGIRTDAAESSSGTGCYLLGTANTTSSSNAGVSTGKSNTTDDHEFTLVVDFDSSKATLSIDGSDEVESDLTGTDVASLRLSIGGSSNVRTINFTEPTITHEYTANYVIVEVSETEAEEYSEYAISYTDSSNEDKTVTGTVVYDGIDYDNDDTVDYKNSTDSGYVVAYKLTGNEITGSYSDIFSVVLN